EVSANADPSVTQLQIKEAGKMVGLVELTLRTERFVKPNPIPENVPEPVIAWSVLTDRQTRAAFGHYISAKYYCVEADIRNRTGYDYQVTNIEFKIPNISSNVPATTLGMARAALERGHLIGLRNTSLSLIKAAGPFFTGFTPFFKVQNHQLTLDRSINIF